MAILSGTKAAGAVVQKYGPHSTNTVTASGDSTLITGPAAGSRLVFKELMVQNESAVETTYILKDGTTPFWRFKLAAGQAITFTYEKGDELRLGDGAALVLNSSGANLTGWSARRFTEVVE